MKIFYWLARMLKEGPVSLSGGKHVNKERIINYQ